MVGWRAREKPMFLVSLGGLDCSAAATGSQHRTARRGTNKEVGDTLGSTWARNPSVESIGSVWMQKSTTVQYLVPVSVPEEGRTSRISH